MSEFVPSLSNSRPLRLPPTRSFPCMPASLRVILLVVCLDAIGIGIILPILPDLLRQIMGQRDVADHFGWFLSVYALMQFVFSPVLGALSDRFGRRPVLLVSLVGAAIDYLVMAVAPNLTILYLGRVISGITGASMAVATSSIADSSTEENRAKNFGLMHAAFGLGFVIGPVIGGLFGAWSLRAPFVVAAVLNGVSFAVSTFALKESLPPEKRRSIALAGLNPVRSLTWAWTIKPLVPFLSVFFIMQLAGQMPGALWTISNQDRFGWSVATVGASFGVFGVLMAFAQACLTEPATKRFGEYRCLLLGMVCECTCYVLFGLATSTPMIFLIMVPLALGGVAMPAMQSLISKRVPDSQQGELQGTLVSLMSLTTIVGPPIYTRIYDRLPAQHSGLIWVIAASLYVICLPLIRGLRTSSQMESHSAQGESSETSPQAESVVPAAD
jgi:DHA1 family tetracycline resistance protein-like MFS transporter